MSQKAYPIGEQLRAVVKNKPFLMAVVGQLLFGFILYGRNADLIYYFKYVEGNEDLFSFFSGVIVIPSIIGAAIFPLVFKWTGNKGWAASVFSVLMGISMVVLYFFSPNEDPVLFYTFAALAQFFFSGFTLCVSPDNALDTVLLDIPSSLAISIIVVCFIWFVVLSYAYN